MQRGYDSVSINGRSLAYQGLARLKSGTDAPTAAEKTKENGFDEMLVSVVTPNGESERLMIYANRLDFSFKKRNVVPDLRINGQPAVLLHYEDEANGFWERAVRGVGLGFKEAFEAVATMARRSVEGIVITGTVAMAGGTALIAMRGGSEATSLISQIVRLVASNVLFIGAGVVAIGSTLIALSGVFRAIASGPAQSKMGTIASVIDDDPIKGLSGVGSYPKPDKAPSQAPLVSPLKQRVESLPDSAPIRGLQGFGSYGLRDSKQEAVSEPSAGKRLNLDAFKDLYIP